MEFDQDGDTVKTSSEQQSVGKKRHWLTRQRVRAYAGALFIIYLLAPLASFLHSNWTHLLLPGMLAQDYLAFWSASHMALQGHAIDAYSVKMIGAVEHSVIKNLTSFLPWLYPPTFLLLIYPVALLPYQLSDVIFLGVTLLAFVVVIHKTLPGKLTTLTALAFPGVAIALLSGQNSLLTAAMMGFGLMQLRRRPILAGIGFGLLCIKPHLAVLIPLALLCFRSWKALIATALTAMVWGAISVLVFGTGTIMAFIHSMGLIQGIINSAGPILVRVPTFFSLARQLHLPSPVAYAFQAISACTAIAAVIYVWNRPSAYELRAATLACATLAVSPYLLDYDLTWYGLVIVWYCKHALSHGFRRYEREWLIFLWIAPSLGLLLAWPLHFQFLPFVTIGTLAMLVTRVRAERRDVARDHPLAVEVVR
jgi:hypothetical protein